MKNIGDIDKNLKVLRDFSREGLSYHDVLDAPFTVHGVFHNGERFVRMPSDVARSVSDGVYALHDHTAGGRVRFRTDSRRIAIRAYMDNVYRMPHFAFSGSCGFDLYVDGRYHSTFMPPVDIEDGYESMLELSGEMRDIEINMPLYSGVTGLEIGLDEGSALEAPRKYSRALPVVFYGSSITQGGCASRPGMSYEAILSRTFDFDYVNLGFSGNARAELEMAEYIKGLEMSAFVYDYDHNAPSVEHLIKTHKRMFDIIRSAHPELPILLLSRPNHWVDEEKDERAQVIISTYNQAKAAGDENVYFIPGSRLMSVGMEEGTVDNCHPTDLGFFSMASEIAKSGFFSQSK